MRDWSLAAPIVMVGLLAASPAQAQDTIPDQIVVLNNQEAIDVPFAFGDVSVGSSEIVKVVPLREEKQLLIAGRTVGTTNVILYDTKGARRSSRRTSPR
jgi:Flp pilus assembly secretin CpaC